MKKRTPRILLVLLALLPRLTWAPTGHAMTLEKPPASAEDPVRAEEATVVALESRTIGPGEVLAFETVAPELAGNPFAEGYYPGPLTVELTGPIVIESGGCLVIGTLAVGNPKEPCPLIRGGLRPEGLITVKPGGQLILKTVSFDLTGDGLFLIQEPGGIVELTDTPLQSVPVQWAPPTVNNLYAQPSPLWLEVGTPLTAELLPAELTADLRAEGASRRVSLALRWDLDGYDGRTEGEYTLTGEFLDEDGSPLLSARPLELPVRWYAPDALVIVSATWMGDSAASAKLRLRELPEDADRVWGELSADGGQTWTEWDRFEVRAEEDGPVTALFSLSDSVPRLFRVRAADEDLRHTWVSEGVLLPKEPNSAEDPGGNRGGGATVAKPTRTPRPPEPTPEPTARPTQAPSRSPVSTSEPPSSPAPFAVLSDTAAEAPAPTPTPTPVPTAVAEARAPAPLLQLLAVAAGVVLCAGVGVLYSFRGHKKR